MTFGWRFLPFIWDVNEAYLLLEIGTCVMAGLRIVYS